MRIPFIFLFLASLSTLSACLSDVNEPSNTPIAEVRFIHAATTAPNLDFAVANSANAGYTLVRDETLYGFSYPYDEFRTGEREFAAFLSHAGFRISTSKQIIDADKKYSVIALDLANAVDTNLLVVSDTLASPDSSKAFVRFVHASSDAGAVSFSIDNATIFSGISRRMVTPYLALAAGSVNIKVASSESGSGIILESPQTFFDGGIYTVILSGSVSPNASIGLNVKSYLEVNL